MLDPCDVFEGDILPADCAGSFQTDIRNADLSVFCAKVIEACLEQSPVSSFGRAANMCSSVDSLVLLVGQDGSVHSQLQLHGVSQGCPGAGVLLVFSVQQQCVRCVFKFRVRWMVLTPEHFGSGMT